MWIRNAIKSGNLNLCDRDTIVVAADIFRKHCINEIKWICACRLIGVLPPRQWKGLADTKHKSLAEAGAEVTREGGDLT